MAMDDVNRRKDILPGYTLRMHSNDSQVQWDLNIQNLCWKHKISENDQIFSSKNWPCWTHQRHHKGLIKWVCWLQHDINVWDTSLSEWGKIVCLPIEKCVGNSVHYYFKLIMVCSQFWPYVTFQSYRNGWGITHKKMYICSRFLKWSKINQAEDIYNDKSSINPRYWLRNIGDSTTTLFLQCEPGLAALVMYDLLYQDPRKLMLLAGCSTVCTTVAETAKMWNLNVVRNPKIGPNFSPEIWRNTVTILKFSAFYSFAMVPARRHCQIDKDFPICSGLIPQRRCTIRPELNYFSNTVGHVWQYYNRLKKFSFL